MKFNVEMMAEKMVKLRGDRTLDEVAEALQISKAALSMYEAGKRIPRDVIKLRIASYYGKSIGFIFFDVEEHGM
ncbi:MAG: helix-turn-helix transcriptional regulator [Lachnospiraceae bacterium]|nr:helix-turn-helix transcriptional regulator [Lachnospiraceae bacterium]